jgi:broad specificity phosphatase PhoE
VGETRIPEIPTIIYCSPFIRCIETAEEIA